MTLLIKKKNLINDPVRTVYDGFHVQTEEIDYILVPLEEFGEYESSQSVTPVYAM